MLDEIIETEYTRHPTCPWCGKPDPDAWELPFDGLGDEVESECAHCGTEYHVVRHVDVSYSTIIKGGNK